MIALVSTITTETRRKVFTNQLCRGGGSGSGGSSGSGGGGSGSGASSGSGSGSGAKVTHIWACASHLVTQPLRDTIAQSHQCNAYGQIHTRVRDERGGGSCGCSGGSSGGGACRTRPRSGWPNVIEVGASTCLSGACGSRGSCGSRAGPTISAIMRVADHSGDSSDDEQTTQHSS